MIFCQLQSVDSIKMRMSQGKDIQPEIVGSNSIAVT